MIGDQQVGPGLYVKIGADTTGLEAGLAKTKLDLTKWRDETNASTKDMASWGAAIGATVAPMLAVGAAAYGLIEKYGGMAQQLKDLSITTGLTTQKLQELQWAAVLSGTSFDRAAFAITNLNFKMQEATDKSSAAYDAFYKLGVNPEGKTPDQVFEATALALSHIEDPTKRATLANELYGRTWREILPFIESYQKQK
jgi:hypothetical protein